LSWRRWMLRGRHQAGMWECRRNSLSKTPVRNAKAAVEEDIVPGGGVELLQAGAKAFDELKLQCDEATVAAIVKKALEEPIKQIALNARPRGRRHGRAGSQPHPG
jgi:hypothetical protein